MRVEETANFYLCKMGLKNEISGTVLDHNGQTLTQDINVIVKAYKNVASGGYVAKAQADSEGHFYHCGFKSRWGLLFAGNCVSEWGFGEGSVEWGG
jgi:hypothetical protein